MVSAATQGMGIAFVPENYAKEQINSGNLITILEDWCPDEAGFHLYFEKSKRIC